MLVYYCNPNFFLFIQLREKEKESHHQQQNHHHHMDVLNLILRAVGLPQLSSSMQGLKSGEDDLHRLHHL